MRKDANKKPLQSRGVGTVLLDFLLTACKNSGYQLIKVEPGGGTDYSHEGDNHLIESYGCKIHARPENDDPQKARIAFYEKRPSALFQKKGITYIL